ncbi:antibiotic biosynthesis monooxygenase [Pectinatus haikarae]|uniref:antibiotic biosynthesis monooxygenase n=1 Tax=Pectinatus haikarae TaxID=349096 RepID=UPI0018C6256A|nr:antibiotic biosynthesis monooxygenase [Pectinatus haikarae]
MIVTCVTIYVKKEYINEFVEATLENHTHSIEEAGNFRFDVLQSNDDETKFLLYEAYKTKEAAAEHKKTAHYLKWRDTVVVWMERPREGVGYSAIAPNISLINR